jgi:hypothetical protein
MSMMQADEDHRFNRFYRSVFYRKRADSSA